MYQTSKTKSNRHKAVVKNNTKLDYNEVNIDQFQSIKSASN